jgi:hypothetical protein
MSEKKKKTKEEKTIEIISNLEETIELGGNKDTIAKLKSILENVKDGTHIVPKKRGRRPTNKKKNETTNPEEQW